MHCELLYLVSDIDLIMKRNLVLTDIEENHFA